MTKYNWHFAAIRRVLAFTVEDQVRGIVSCVSQRIGIFWLVKSVFIDTSVLLRCYYAFVLPILEYCSPVWGVLLNAIFSFVSDRCIRWPVFALIRLSYRCVIDVMLLHCVCCTRLIRTRIIGCSVSFPSASVSFIRSCGCSSSIRVWSIKV